MSSLDNWRTKQQAVLIYRQQKRSLTEQKKSNPSRDSASRSYRKELFGDESTLGEDVPEFMKPDAHDTSGVLEIGTLVN